MKAIYEPKGRAKEYADLACNLYRGCKNKCLYCYAPAVLREKRESFHNRAIPRPGIINALKRDAARMEKHDKRHVLLCFTCDPYPDDDKTSHTTRGAISILKSEGVNIEVLTKGGKKAVRDFDLYGPEDRFATTLTLVDVMESLKWEPDAALPGDRIEAIREAKSRNITTWVSLEPVIDPAQTLELIAMTHTIVDKYKVGTLNYHEYAKGIDWKTFGDNVVSLLDKLGKDYYLKDDLRRKMGAINEEM